MSRTLPTWYRRMRRHGFLVGTTLFLIYAIRSLNMDASSLLKTTTTTLKKRVDRNASTFPKERAQMGWDQVQNILEHLPIDGNLLVWGLGNDSPFWNTATSGTVVFLEDATWDTNLIPSPTDSKTQIRWFDLVTQQHPELQAYTVQYTTRNTPDQREYFRNNPDVWNESLNMEDLPDVVWNTVWDVILVDAPLGHKDTGPGRFQSIYMTRQLVQRSFELLLEQGALDVDNDRAVHVLVDDYERPLEREFSQLVYDRAPVRVVSRLKYGTHVSPNQQAHFIFHANDL